MHTFSPEGAGRHLLLTTSRNALCRACNTSSAYLEPCLAVIPSQPVARAFPPHPLNASCCRAFKEEEQRRRREEEAARRRLDGPDGEEGEDRGRGRCAGRAGAAATGSSHPTDMALMRAVVRQIYANLQCPPCSRLDGTGGGHCAINSSLPVLELQETEIK